MLERHLFKAKRMDNGEWVKGALCETSWGSSFIIKNDPNIVPDTIKVNPDTICQCTGLKDKNGNLIWENDIVNGSIKRGAAFYRCFVLWNECKARFDVRALGCNFPMTLDECTDDISMSGFDYEVVGNKFDNPELLEE